jgi:hypothetical protein
MAQGSPAHTLWRRHRSRAAQPAPPCLSTAPSALGSPRAAARRAKMARLCWGACKSASQTYCAARRAAAAQRQQRLRARSFADAERARRDGSAASCRGARLQQRCLCGILQLNVEGDARARRGWREQKPQPPAVLAVRRRRARHQVARQLLRQHALILVAQRDGIRRHAQDDLGARPRRQRVPARREHAARRAALQPRRRCRPLSARRRLLDAPARGSTTLGPIGGVVLRS